MTTNGAEIEDHGHEIHCFGPPGTGKTTFLANRIGSTVYARGYDSVIVSSFTVAAAAELSSRRLPLPKKAVGTLHSHAYKAIGAPPMAAERVTEWNAAHPSMQLADGGGKGAVDPDAAPEEWVGATEGDVLAGRADSLRNRMVSLDRWPRDVAVFHAAREEWKRAEGVIDFTDMIEIARETTVTAPGSPEVGFFDEAQDNTLLELDLIRHWGQHMDRIVLAGDDDQQLYSFRGAEPDGLLAHPVPSGDRLVLPKSYRLPGTVHAAAERFVHRLSRREEKRYSPRREDPDDDASPIVPGAVIYDDQLNYMNPVPLLHAVDAELEQGRTVMVLAACAYMLDPFKHEMRKAGMPFHNPCRRKRGDWNPLGATRGVASKDRLLSYFAANNDTPLGGGEQGWTGDDVRRWTHVVKTQGVLVRGAKQLIADLPNRVLAYHEVAGLFEDQAALESAWESSLPWLEANLLKAAKAGMTYPLAVAGARGSVALTEDPRVVLGTIHSTKGAEADAVFLIPDLSGRGAREWASGGERRDAVIRQFYVGLTRAREKLVVCAPAMKGPAPRCVNPRLLIEGADDFRAVA